MDELALKQQQKSKMLRQYPGLFMKKKKLVWRIIVILVVAVLFAGMVSAVIGSVYQSAVSEGTAGQAEYAAFESIYNKALEKYPPKTDDDRAMSLLYYVLPYPLAAGAFFCLLAVLLVCLHNSKCKKAQKAVDESGIRNAYNTLSAEITQISRARENAAEAIRKHRTCENCANFVDHYIFSYDGDSGDIYECSIHGKRSYVTYNCKDFVEEE